MFVLVIGVSVGSVVEVAKLHLDHTPRWPPEITPLTAQKLHHVRGRYPFGVITVLVGPAFTQSAEVLPLAGYSAALFTFSYLCATYLAALDERSGIWLVAAFLPLQLCILMLLSMSESGLTLPEMMRTKLLCQIGLSVSLIVLIVRRSRSWTTSMRPQKSYHEIER